MAIAMRPRSGGMTIGGTISVPPWAVTRAIVASASATPKYTVQVTGAASCSGIFGAIAAAGIPFAKAMV